MTFRHFIQFMTKSNCFRSHLHDMFAEYYEAISYRGTLILNKKIAFFKSSAPRGPRPRLTHKSIAANYCKGINTTLIPDTNILINIERLMNRGGLWSEIKASGIGELVSLLKKLPPFSTYISPGVALHEIPPGRANAAEQAFNKFLERYLPNFVDSPDSLPVSAIGPQTGPYVFADLDIAAQQVLGSGPIDFRLAA